jgi:UDP-N-acetylglucosamine 3-dehydrogenase
MRRVGIVGAGLIGTWHAAQWKRLPVKLAGFYDVAPETAAEAVAEFGGRAFDGLDDLLAAVDVVDVCSPTPYHRVPVLAAAAAGRDVVCEKPLARRLDEAKEMVTACQAAGVRLFVAQVVRFFHQFSQAKAILDSGALGRPGFIRAVRGCAPPDPGRRAWFADFGQSGGAVMDVSIHDLDYAHWCFGDVERVFARGLTFAGVEPYDHALITLRFRNGAIGHIEGSWAYPPDRFHTRFEIAGDQGLLEFDDLAPAPLTVTLKSESGKSPQAPGTPKPHSPLAPRDDPYFLELAHFLNCLESGDAFLVSPQDGLEAVKLALAAIESIRIGRPVYLDEFEESVA